MAGICCGIVAENEGSISSTQIEAKSNRVNSRRRRMEIRQLKFPAAADMISTTKRNRMEEAAAVEDNRKKIELSADCASVELDRAVVKAARFGMTSVCGRRRDMEDAVSLQPGFWRQEGESRDDDECDFYGVYDGHGCSHVAKKCKTMMHEILTAQLNASSAGQNEVVPWKEVMDKSFVLMDLEARESRNRTQSSTSPDSVSCRCELQLPQCDAVGSTAVVSVLTSDKIVVANCGDSRAVLCRNGAALPLSDDHKPDRPDELKRIEEAGGRVIYWDGPRVLGVLAMSRAIGDSYLKPYVIPDPEVRILDRSDEDECLILASDGLWDVVSNETACNVARMCLKAGRTGERSLGEVEVGGSSEGSDKGCVDASILLTKLAMARGSGDNVSVVVVDLKTDQRGRSRC